MDPLTLMAIASTGAGIASQFIPKKKSGGETKPGQYMADEQLSEWIKQYLPNYIPGRGYSGKLTAPMSSYETTGLDKLRSVLAGPDTGELFGAAKGQILDTLGGKYADPNTSPFIRAMTNLSKINLRDTIDQSRRQRGARGTYFTQDAIEEEGRLSEGVLSKLDAIVGDFMNQERGRMQAAVPQAGVLDEYENLTAPLKKISASQTYGSLPRLIEQADLEARYNDFGRQQNELSGVVNTARSTPYLPSYTTPVMEQDSQLASILKVISQLNLGAMQGGGSIWDKLGGVLKGPGTNSPG